MIKNKHPAKCPLDGMSSKTAYKMSIIPIYAIKMIVLRQKLGFLLN